jgi:hypothetical protein
MLLASCAAAAPLQCGQIAVQYRSGSGARITFAGIPLIRSSSVQLHSPGWKQGYYSSNNNPPEAKNGQSSVSVSHVTDKLVKFTATETWQAVADNRIELTLSGQLQSSVEAELEWTIGYVNAFALYGGSVVDSADASRQPVRIEPMAGVDAEDTAVIRASSCIELQTRAGRVRFRLDSPHAAMTLLDGRKTPRRWWAREAPSFWLGVLNLKLTPGRPFEVRAVIEFEPSSLERNQSRCLAPSKLIRVDPVFAPPDDPIRIIPTPRRMEVGQGRIVLPADLTIHYDPPAGGGAARLAAALNARHGMTTRAIERPLMFDTTDEPAIRFLAANAAECRPEGYRIRCGTDGIEVRAADAAGFRFAAESLLQLLRRSVEGQVVVPECWIDDHPSLSFRGVHLFPGRDSLEFHRRLIENVFARYKFNHVVLECEYTQWDTARGIWIDISVPKPQLAEYVRILRAAGLEPIPLVQSLGHSRWMFRNSQNLNLAEDPDTPEAYDATNPRTYELVDRVYDEAIAIFQPKWFHIGHDEVTLFGKYPNREQSRAWGVTKLFVSDIEHWVRFFKPKDIAMMMWGDMLLAREEIRDGAASADTVEEARARRQAISKDIVICDWHYDDLPADEYPSLALLREAGFRTIACTWHNPMNIYGFAEAARRSGAWGLLQTTWAGYHIDESTLDRQLRQFSAYILAAEYAWSDNSPAPDKLPWRADEVLIRSLQPDAKPTGPKAGFLVDLSDADRVDLPAIRGIAGVKQVGGLRFSNLGPKGIVLSGRLGVDGARTHSSVTININTRADGLAFLHATAFPAEPGETVGEYVVHFDDGASSRIPLVYGRNIRAVDDPAIAGEAIDAWIGRSENGLSAAARLFVWTNPHPENPISRVTLSTDHPYASPALFGLSGISTQR